MKKFILLILCIVIALSFTGCNSKLKDGTYTVEMSNEAAEKNHGWKDKLVIVVKNNNATIKEFDSYSTEDGRAKSKDENYGMSLEEHGTQPSVYFPQLKKNWENAKGDPSKIETITGATQSSNSLKSMMAIALESAKKGIKTTQIYNGNP